MKCVATSWDLILLFFQIMFTMISFNRVCIYLMGLLMMVLLPFIALFWLLIADVAIIKNFFSVKFDWNSNIYLSMIMITFQLNFLYLQMYFYFQNLGNLIRIFQLDFWDQQVFSFMLRFQTHTLYRLNFMFLFELMDQKFKKFMPSVVYSFY